jgi:hypothetical protein
MKPTEIQQYGLGWRFTWAEHRIDITIDQIKETSSNTKAEVHVRYVTPTGFQSVAYEDLNLKTASSRSNFVKHLVSLDSDPDKDTAKQKWMCCVETACMHALSERRRGEPALRLSPSPVVKSLPWRINPWIYEAQPTVIFAPGGSGKSYLALLASMLVQAGGYFQPIGAGGEPRHSNLCALPGETLLLDWEADRDASEMRWANLMKGHPEYVGIHPPYYRRMERSLGDDLREVQRIVSDTGVKLVIVDSLAPAAGGDPNAPETAITFHKALRALKVSSLSLAHVAKDSQGQARSIFGSAFFTNLARSVWQLEPSSDDESTIKYVTLRHTKVNDGPKQRPMSFKIDFQHTSGGTHIEPISLDELPSPEINQSKVDQIKAALAEGSKDNEELVVATGLPASAIRSRCHDGKDKWCTKVGGKWRLLGARK